MKTSETCSWNRLLPVGILLFFQAIPCHGQPLSSEVIVKNLCAASDNGKSPFCDLRATCSVDSSLSFCSSQNSDQLLSRMCATDFAGNSACVNANLVNSQIPSISSIPTARNASNAVYLICNDMPTMADCKTCPPPSPQTGLSDCPLLDTLSKLCLSMPGMSECSRFATFCSLNPASSFCGDSSSTKSTTVLQSIFCTDANEICINATFVSSSETCFSISANTDGWVGLGIGTSIMAGSDIYLAWRDGNQLQIGNYQGTGPVQPSYRSSQSSLLSSRLVQSYSASSPFSFEFCRDSLVSKIEVVESTPFLYAWARSKPASGSDLKSATILQHDGGYDAFIFPKPTSVSLVSSISPISESVATSLSSELCNQMPYMASCSLKQSSSVSPMQLYATLCTDMPSMRACLTFNETCISSTDSFCKPITNFPSSAAVTKAIYSICNQMNMPDCSACSSSISTPNQSYASCDIMNTFTRLCQSMPGMDDCKLYSSMCSSTPSLSFCSKSLVPPEMKMYFHTGILDYILVESWVPRTNGEYLGALVFIFFLSFGAKGVDYVINRWEREWRKEQLLAKQVAILQKVEDPPVEILGGENRIGMKDSAVLILKRMTSRSNTNSIRIALLRGSLQFVANALHLLVMLIAMTFNLGFFLVILFGLSFGAIVFTPLAYEFQDKSNYEGLTKNECC